VDGIRPYRCEGKGDVRESHGHKRVLVKVGTTVLALATAGLILGACSSGNGSASGSTTPKDGSKGTTTTIVSKDPSTTVTRTTQTTIAFSVAQVHTGTGPSSLAQFTVPSKASEWDIDWVYDCASQPTKTGTFSLTVVGHGSASDTTDAGVPQQSGNGTAGLVRNYDTGTFNLNVKSACKWTVRVEIIN